MLTEFFLKLRDGGVPASIKEYLTLIEGLQKHVASGSMEEFYFLARTTLVKDESNYDRKDKADIRGHRSEHAAKARRAQDSCRARDGTQRT